MHYIQQHLTFSHFLLNAMSSKDKRSNHRDWCSHREFSRPFGFALLNDLAIRPKSKTTFIALLKYGMYCYLTIFKLLYGLKPFTIFEITSKS